MAPSKLLMADFQSCFSEEFASHQVKIERVGGSNLRGGLAFTSGTLEILASFRGSQRDAHSKLGSGANARECSVDDSQGLIRAVWR